MNRGLLANIFGILLGILYMVSGLIKVYVKENVNIFFIVFGLAIIMIYTFFIYRENKSGKN